MAVLIFHPLLTSVDVDGDTAGDAARAELSKPIYPHESLWDRLVDWIFQRLIHIQFAAADLPGGWLTIVVTALILIVAVVLLVRLARRSTRGTQAGLTLFDDGELTSAEHRATAEHLAAQGNWSEACQHRLRAVARRLEERGILSPAPGRTALETAAEAGRELPGIAREFRSCAEIFNDISYGHRSGTEVLYQQIVGLDKDVGLARTDAKTSTPPSAVEWETVR